MQFQSKLQFQLGLIRLFTVMIVLIVGPFALWRFMNGELIKASVNLAIILTVLLMAALTYHRRIPRTSIVLAALFYTFAVVGVIYLNNHQYLIWLHPVIIANFLLLSARVAGVANVLAVIAVIPVLLQAEALITSASALASLIFSAFMAYSFARLTDQQRTLLSAAATEDALTGIGNRRLMDLELNRAIANHERDALPVSLIVLDLDHFKRTNDRYGHTVGDQLLTELAQLLRERIRATDQVFRYGGEEFVVLARGTTLPEAEHLAEELRNRVSQRLTTPGGPVSASLGCAQLKPQETAEAWFRRADMAMFAAKEQGRNRVWAAA